MSRRQKDIVHGCISGKTLFPNLGIRLKAELDRLANDTQQALDDELNGLMDRLARDVAMVVAAGGNEDEMLAGGTTRLPEAALQKFQRKLGGLESRL